jgi:hypothetical protein
MPMTREQYRVWVPTDGETEDDCVLVMAHDHEAAAKNEVERRYNDDPFFSAMTVMVRCTFGGDDGELRCFEVHPEPTVWFNAYEVDL